MSRSLPPHPDLEHLRKQAKRLLRDLQQRNPDQQLADAQHALAREYGFPTWPQLVAHVESSRSLTDNASPFDGTWVADVAKSRRHPANLFRQATIRFDVAGDTVTVANVMVDALGQEQRATHTFLADGVEYPAESGNGYALRARWRGPRVLDTEATKDGAPAGWGRYEVSADGTTLTILSDDQAIVLDRA